VLAVDASGQWAGPELHVQTVDWTLVKDEANEDGQAIGCNAIADRSRASVTARPRLCAPSHAMSMTRAEKRTGGEKDSRIIA
jgi:hypothetical protein